MRTKIITYFSSTKRKIYLGLFLILIIWFIFCLPRPLFKEPTSSVLLDKDQRLLSAVIATDGQWRFPNSHHVPEKFEKCIIQFEDRSFYRHPGFNPLAFGRALWQNITSGKRKSGGSTITMQVIRLARKNKSRTIFEKIVEVIWATRLECSNSKKEVLSLYASYAPFGSNVVGLQAASWRYFGRSADELSWAESATLAVLPNAPALIYPGKNQQKLFAKRNRLLIRLKEAGIIDESTCELAMQEPLPEKPFPLPQLGSHLLVRAAKEGMKGKIITTTLDKVLEERVSDIIERHHQVLKGNEIHNAAALVLDVETGNVLAYVGNTKKDEKDQHGNDVDIIMAPRSTGSILKPFLYAHMLSNGDLLPNMLVPDIPTQLSGYSPLNYNISYDGAVPAKRALARSLNIPAVRMLLNYGTTKFHNRLKTMGMSTLTFPADHYGLTLILGGAEARLWDLAGMYAGMGRTLLHYGKDEKTYFHPPAYLANKKFNDVLSSDEIGLDAASIKLALDAMVEVSRPDEEAGWKMFSSSSPVAWKTGTSFGFRDAWAIGITPKYVVAVWVGNASGEGRPGLVGVATAAPIMFDIFHVLPKSSWFITPYDDMERIPVCRESGHRASALCENADSMWVPTAGLKTSVCPYHRLIHLDASGKYRVNSNCAEVSEMRHVPWFVLPPSWEMYYKSKNSSYKLLPPFKPGCENTGSNTMELIYPRNYTKIYVPKELDGNYGKTIFHAAHRRPHATIYWHIDDQFAGSTSEIHQMGSNPLPGKHTLTLVDDEGETLNLNFEIISK